MPVTLLEGDNPKTMQRTKERLRTIMREATEDEALIYMLDTPGRSTVTNNSYGLLQYKACRHFLILNAYN